MQRGGNGPDACVLRLSVRPACDRVSVFRAVDSHFADWLAGRQGRHRDFRKLFDVDLRTYFPPPRPSPSPLVEIGRHIGGGERWGGMLWNRENRGGSTILAMDGSYMIPFFFIAASGLT